MTAAGTGAHGTSRPTVLEARGLSRLAGDRAIVAEVSFGLEQGTVTALTGPSGSGKSSLLRLLVRLDEPTGGTVLLDGADYRNLPPPVLRRRVGLVLQTPFLFAGTVADNVRFGPAQRGERLSDADVDGLLARMGLAGFGERTVDRLSGGEAQRVSLARTLANRPEVLLLDEPTSALDESARGEVEDVVRATIADRELTCLIVTHDPAQAERLAGRILSIDRGRLVGDRSSAARAPGADRPAEAAV
ncbi:MAG TPA: ATP-binding cassette domain-containing protein [Candidatus Limnocylindrales bacterium]|nr:ATP-binding cassette domain-containing protein [Candidatus Limnocylindrales bacterium]